ncbi:uncharacterized protein LOC128202575 [Galleria mellonella]|uniref:Uncharacterized protein LOC128202575 n=1 Tax=Galleria mellonella TaxID=7137 RepID=A0ABM3N6W7_GALME|nr:uncharacterized protein LOC128202575 [Galleria mellonella]
MTRRIDEDTILQLLLEDNSDQENSSESEKEDHIEVDPAYVSVSEDEISSLDLASIEEQIPSTSAQEPNELIIIPSRNILRGKYKHKWSSLKPKSQGRTVARNIVHIRPGPTRMCKNELDPLRCFSSFITDDIVNIIVTYTNAEIVIKYKNTKILHHKLVEPHMQKRILVPTLQTGLRDSITQILNMPGSSRSSLTLETEATGHPIAKKKKKNLCRMPISKTKDDEN